MEPDPHAGSWRTGWACALCRAHLYPEQPRCHICGHELAVRIILPELTPAGRPKAAAS